MEQELLEKKADRNDSSSGYLTDSMVRELKLKIVDPSRRASNIAYLNLCCWNFSKRERKRIQTRDKAKSRRSVRQPHKHTVRLTSIFETGIHKLSTDTIRHQLTAWLSNNGYEICHARPWTIGHMSCQASDDIGYGACHMADDGYQGNHDPDQGKDYKRTDHMMTYDMDRSTDLHSVQRTHAEMIDKACETDELADDLAKMRDYMDVKDDKLWQ